RTTPPRGWRREWPTMRPPTSSKAAPTGEPPTERPSDADRIRRGGGPGADPGRYTGIPAAQGDPAMTDGAKSALPSLISRYEKEILDEWVKLQVSSDTHRRDLATERDVRSDSQRFLEAMRTAIAAGTDIRTPEWADVKSLLTEISQNRARQGFSPTETATFVLSIKQPLFSRIRTE